MKGSHKNFVIVKRNIEETYFI